ncbi:MAG: hypothetical protein QXG00_06440 [Candidatus Woesearchaeota archaeon]
MKKVKCPNCYRERKVEDNIIIVICPVCQIEMGVIENGRKK